jgi:hypothetical protein
VGAFEGVVEQETYDKAQKILRDATLHKSNAELLAALREFLSRNGRISEHLIDQALDLPSSATYIKRFGGLRQAYALIGYKEDRNIPRMLKTRISLKRLRRSVFTQITRIFRNQVAAIQERGGARQALRFQDGTKLSIAICQFVHWNGSGARWCFTLNRFERDYPTLICRCTPDNKSLRDFYLMPRIVTPYKAGFWLRNNDSWLKGGKRIRNLSLLKETLDRIVAEPVSVAA